jgi:hypothetical protein
MIIYNHQNDMYSWTKIILIKFGTKDRMAVNICMTFADKQRLLGRYSSLMDSDHGVCFFFLVYDPIRHEYGSFHRKF